MILMTKPKKKFQGEIVLRVNYSSLETVCDLCLQRLSYKPTEKLIKKTIPKTKICFRKQNF